MRLLTKLVSWCFPDAEVVVNRVAGKAARRDRVVLLLGFGGGSKRFLKSFSDYHNAEGRSTVAFTMPMSIPPTARRWFEDRLAEKLHEVRLQEATLAGNAHTSVKISVHSFSNNGSWVLGQLHRRRLLSSEHLSEIIIDSAPQFWYHLMPLSREVEVYGKIATSVLTSRRGQQPCYWSPVITPVLWVPIFVSCAISRVLTLLSSALPLSLQDILATDFVGMNRYLRDEFPRVPTLFMYSEGDKLVTAPEVKEFVELQRAKRAASGMPSDSIWEEVFTEDSIPHVGLWHNARNQYKDAVRTFLERGEK